MRTQSRVAVIAWVASIVVASCGGSVSAPAPDMSSATTTSVAAPAQGDGGDLVETTEPNVYLLAASTGDPRVGCRVPPGLIVTPTPLPGHFDGISEWIDVSRGDLVAAMSRSSVDGDNEFANLIGPNDASDLSRDGNLVALRRGAANEFSEWLYRPGLEKLLAERSEDSVLLGLSISARDDAGFIIMAIVGHGDGGFTVMGRCESQAVVRGIERYAMALGEIDAYGLFRQIAADDAALAALENWIVSPPGIDWVDVPPRDRLIDVEATPPEVLDELTSILILVEGMPEEWKAFDAVLCTWMSLGWNECTALDAFDKPPLELFGYFNESETFELWLADERANLSDPLALIGIFDAGLADEDGIIRLSVSGSQTSLQELIDDVESGIDVVQAVK